MLCFSQGFLRDQKHHLALVRDSNSQDNLRATKWDAFCMTARNSCFNKASRWFWFLLKFSLSYIFWAYIFVVDDLDESSRIHIGGLNLSSHLNAPSYFTNYIIQKLKLNFPLSILFTRGRIKTSTWHRKPLLHIYSLSLCL